MRSPDDAQDVAQDVWLKVAKAFPKLRDPQRFLPWLFRIARNTALDHVQARRSRLFSTLTGEDDQGFDVTDSPEGEPESRLLSTDERRKVWEALGALSERDRTALFLRELEGFSYGEVADTLGISRGTAEVVMFRARRRFREQFVKAEKAESRCKVIPIQLSSMIDGELAPEIRDRLQAHLAVCDSCREWFDTMQVGRRLFRGFGLFLVPSSVSAAVHAKLAALLGGSTTGTAVAAGGGLAGAGVTGGAVASGGSLVGGSILTGALAKVAMAVVVVSATAATVQHDASTTPQAPHQEIVQWSAPVDAQSPSWTVTTLTMPVAPSQPDTQAAVEARADAPGDPAVSNPFAPAQSDTSVFSVAPQRQPAVDGIVPATAPVAPSTPALVLPTNTNVATGATTTVASAASSATPETPFGDTPVKNLFPTPIDSGGVTKMVPAVPTIPPGADGLSFILELPAAITNPIVGQPAGDTSPVAPVTGVITPVVTNVVAPVAGNVPPANGVTGVVGGVVNGATGVALPSVGLP